MATLQARRDDIVRIAASHGARRIRVFGSVVRSEADDRSDVDVLVAMDSGRTLFDVGAFLVELRDLLGCEVDVVTEGELESAAAWARDAVLREAIAL